MVTMEVRSPTRDGLLASTANYVATACIPHCFAIHIWYPNWQFQLYLVRLNFSASRITGTNGKSTKRFDLRPTEHATHIKSAEGSGRADTAKIWWPLSRRGIAIRLVDRRHLATSIDERHNIIDNSMVRTDSPTCGWGQRTWR